jgi:hypothetical protein
MKNIALLFIIVSLVFSTCSEDPQIKPRDYPYILLQDIVKKDSTSLTLKAEVLNIGNSEFLECGFALDLRYLPTINNVIYMADTFIKTEMQFSYDFGTTLSHTGFFRARAFVITADSQLVYSNEKIYSKSEM